VQSGAALDGIGVSGRGGMTDNRQARGGIRIRIRSMSAGRAAVEIVVWLVWYQ
jgi:hypothetical protein